MREQELDEKLKIRRKEINEELEKNEKIRICQQIFQREEHIRERESQIAEKERKYRPMSPQEFDTEAEEATKKRKMRKSIF